MAKMSSGPLSPDNDYQFPPAPAPAVLDRERWNAFAKSLSERLRYVESGSVELADVVADLRLFGLQRLDEALVPLINDAIAQLEDLQSRIDAADGSIADVREQIAEILVGVIPANSITESATRVFVTPEQRALIGTAAQAVVVEEALEGKADLVSGKVPASQLPDFGGRRLLQTVTISTPVASVDFTGLDTATYYAFELEIDGLSHNNATNTVFAIGLASESEWRASGYQGAYTGADATTARPGAASGTSFTLWASTTSTSLLSGIVRALRLGDPLSRSLVQADVSLAGSVRVFRGSYNIAEKHTGLRFFAEAGLLSAGTIRLYGVK
jgi:hypothetical protein